MIIKPVIRGQAALGFQWPTLDPFLFCVHHKDDYPAGNAAMGPDASLVGRNIGQDFTLNDGWRMYHGETVPGFPQHPHRGFETVTVVRRGLVDHADSLGAAARYGQGDVQWLTAGGGILHAEMFPLVAKDDRNPLELFQIWLNLPSRAKMVGAHFTMMWNASIPRQDIVDDGGRVTRVSVIAGRFGEHVPPAPPPDSWAADVDSDVAIWTLEMAANATFILSAARPGSNRALYFFSGSALWVGGESVAPGHMVEITADAEVALTSGPDAADLLLLQGRPIGEKVVHYGPFVMNSQAEIRQAIFDYQRTRFGGWPWPDDAPVHGRQAGRFARHPDGRREGPG